MCLAVQSSFSPRGGGTEGPLRARAGVGNMNEMQILRLLSINKAF